MRTTTFITWILSLNLCLAACTERPREPVAGYLYFGAGSNLGRLDLSTGGSTRVAGFGDLDIQQLSMGNNELLLSVASAGLGHRQPRVLRFHLSSGRWRVLVMGSAAQYLPDSDSLLYDDGLRLVAVPRRKVRSEGQVLPVTSARSSALAIALADHSVLFPGDGPGDSIQRFDLDRATTETLERLSEQCTLDGALWAASRRQLLCRPPRVDTIAGGYRWVFLDGQLGGELPLPPGREFRALAYIPEGEVIILNETKRVWFEARPRHPVWALRERDGMLQRIARNQYLGNSVVYTHGWR